tara:strand:+ start:226 stop:420 length:195 start_codon:yes stop_codon:yes gene_type:complete
MGCNCIDWYGSLDFCDCDEVKEVESLKEVIIQKEQLIKFLIEIYNLSEEKVNALEDIIRTKHSN